MGGIKVVVWGYKGGGVGGIKVVVWGYKGGGVGCGYKDDGVGCGYKIRVPGEIKKSRDRRGGRWSWTLNFAQKRT